MLFGEATQAVISGRTAEGWDWEGADGAFSVFHPDGSCGQPANRRISAATVVSAARDATKLGLWGGRPSWDPGQQAVLGNGPFKRELVCTFVHGRLLAGTCFSFLCMYKVRIDSVHSGIGSLAGYFQTGKQYHRSSSPHGAHMGPHGGGGALEKASSHDATWFLSVYN